MLTDEQLARRVKAGDDLAFTVLARRYTRLTQSYARKRYAPGLEQQDIDQEAVIGLWAAVRSFDPERGIPFGVLANMAVSRRLDTMVKTALAMKRRVLSDALSLDTTEQGDFDEPFYAAVADPSSVDPSVALERRSVSVGLMNGESYVEIAKRLGLKHGGDYASGQTRSKAVDNALQLARGKVLRALGEDGRRPLGLAA